MDEKRPNRFSDLGAGGAAGFIFREGVLKYGLPLTALVQAIGYFSKHGLSPAGLNEFAAPMNLLLFAVTVLFEGVLFAWMVWNWGDPRRTRDQLRITPTHISSRSAV